MTEALRLTVGEGDDADQFGVSILRVKRGDVILVRAPGEISQYTAERLKQAFEDLLPSDLSVKVAVLGDGLRVDILRTDE